jgi:hypothetical protein
MVHPTPEQRYKGSGGISRQANRRPQRNHRDFDAARPVGTSGNGPLVHRRHREHFPVFRTAFLLDERAIDDGGEILAVEIAGVRRGDDFALARTPD